METIISLALAACCVALGYYWRGGRGELSGSWLRELRSDLEEMEIRIMATQADLAAQLTATALQVEKVGGETRGLITKVEELLAQLAASTEVNPELQAAADAVKAQVDVVDALVPDA